MTEALKEIGLNQNQMREMLSEAMTRWKFAPDKLRGGQKKNRGGRPRVIDASIVVLLDCAFLNYATIEQACLFADISRESFYNWLAMNPTYRDRIELLKQNLGLRARLSVMRGLKFDSDLALKVLERTEPAEFSLKQTLTHNVEFTGISLDKPKPVEAIHEQLPIVESIDRQV